MRSTLRVLLLADTHLGFDYPARPRIERRRRGPDFFRNYQLALEPALRGEVDLVVHAGDLLFRSKVPSGLVTRAFEPLRRVTDRGIPVVVVPGNHERSFLPRPLVADHPLLQVLNAPGTARFTLLGLRVAVSGIPFDRQIRSRFPEMLATTSWSAEPADIRLLCLHQAIEGCRVGQANREGHDFTFRHGDDVVRCADLPSGFAAILSGHIHRHQVLKTDLIGHPLPTPVLYPGSVERTSFAEMHDQKGYLILEIRADESIGGRLDDWHFHGLPARPMHQVRLDAGGMGASELMQAIRDTLAELPTDAVIGLRIKGEISDVAWPALSATSLRSITPRTMNLSLQGIARRRQR